MPKFIAHLKLPPIAAELGVAESLFAEDLLKEGIEKLYLVDRWKEIKDGYGDSQAPQTWHDKNFADAKERMKKFGDKAVFLIGGTIEMANNVPDQTLGLVNVDASHDYPSVMGDAEAWWKKLVNGGIMAFHDYENEKFGVKAAVNKFAQLNRIDIHLLPENKKEDAGCYLIKP